jgi:hypothetical protein
VRPRSRSGTHATRRMLAAVRRHAASPRGRRHDVPREKSRAAVDCRRPALDKTGPGLGATPPGPGGRSGPALAPAPTACRRAVARPRGAEARWRRHDRRPPRTRREMRARISRRARPCDPRMPSNSRRLTPDPFVRSTARSCWPGHRLRRVPGPGMPQCVMHRGRPTPDNRRSRSCHTTNMGDFNRIFDTNTFSIIGENGRAGTTVGTGVSSGRTRRGQGPRARAATVR